MDGDLLFLDNEIVGIRYGFVEERNHVLTKYKYLCFLDGIYTTLYDNGKYDSHRKE